MLKFVQIQPTWLTIERDLFIPGTRENSVDIDIAVLPKKWFEAHALDQQRIVVLVIFESRNILNNKPVQVAMGGCNFDIFTDRDVHLIELYRLAKSVAESIKTLLNTENLSFLKNEQFPIEPPDIVRAKILPELQKINEAKSPFNMN